ncbi:hypothetical protein B7463_g11293, partial [Scytalidium lignicola]
MSPKRPKTPKRAATQPPRSVAEIRTARNPKCRLVTVQHTHSNALAANSKASPPVKQTTNLLGSYFGPLHETQSPNGVVVQDLHGPFMFMPVVYAPLVLVDPVLDNRQLISITGTALPTVPSRSRAASVAESSRNECLARALTNNTSESSAEHHNGARPGD